jgi:hypothetical protein
MSKVPEEKLEDESEEAFADYKAKDADADEDQDEAEASGDEPDDDEDESESDDDEDGSESDDDEDESESDDDDSDEDESPKPAEAKPKPKLKPGKKPGRKPLAASSRAAKRRKKAEKGSSTRNIILYIVVIGGIALAFAYLGQQEGGGAATPAPPKWKAGDVADVSVTLVTTDVKDLACAAEAELDGLHCGYADKRKPHPKGNDTRNDATLLQPYTTTDRVQFLGAGMWTNPELKAKLEKEDWENPSPRFTVNCKYHVAGKMSEAAVRWKPEHGWLADAATDWYAGKLTDCKIRKSGRAIPRMKTPPAKPPESSDKDKPAE